MKLAWQQTPGLKRDPSIRSFHLLRALDQATLEAPALTVSRLSSVVRMKMPSSRPYDLTRHEDTIHNAHHTYIHHNTNRTYTDAKRERREIHSKERRKGNPQIEPIRDSNFFAYGKSSSKQPASSSSSSSKQKKHPHPMLRFWCPAAKKNIRRAPLQPTNQPTDRTETSNRTDLKPGFPFWFPYPQIKHTSLSLSSSRL